MPDLPPFTKNIIYTCIIFSIWQPGIYRWFYINLTPPDIKRQGLFSPCLFCKAVCILRIHKPDSVGPAGPGRHLAYDYYSILHLSLQETCIAFGGTPQTRPVILCTMLWYPVPGNRGFRPFSPVFRESGQITHSLSAGFMQLRPFPIPVYFCICTNPILQKQKGPDKPVLCFLIFQKGSAG